MPCRKCHECLKFTRLEWANRMKMESWSSGRPFFTTWTFAPEVYSNSEKSCKQDIQKFWKKLRKAGHDIRYFTVIERGSQKHRLHGHSILWSKSLKSIPSPKRRHDLLKSVWGNGIIDIQEVRSAAGLNYVTKYMVKDLSEENQRNYSWSQKPMLGKAGRIEWEKMIHHYHEQGIVFDLANMPPNVMRFPIMGEITDVWIPKSDYVRFCKSIGINFIPDNYETPKDWNPLTVEKSGSEPYTYKKAEEYRLSKSL